MRPNIIGPDFTTDAANRNDAEKTTDFLLTDFGVADLEFGGLWRYVASPTDRKNIILCDADRGERAQPAPTTAERTLSYAWNANISAAIVTPPDPNDRPWRTVANGGRCKGIKMASVKSSAQKIMLFEELAPNDTWCLMFEIPFGTTFRGDDLPSGRHGGSRFLNVSRAMTPGSPDYRAWLANGRANHLFFDGHVELLTPGDIQSNPKYFQPLR
jgi:prepilin-type processing-associated H-X9-DG protein